MKIVVTGTRGIPSIQGGIETHCEELYPLIADDQHQIIIARRPEYAIDRQVKVYKGVAIKDISVPRSKHLEAFLHTFLVVIYAWRVRADIVHIHAVGPALMSPLVRLLGMKVIVTHHGFDYDRDKWGAFAKWVLRLGEKIGVSYANHVIVISEHIRQIMYKKYPIQNKISLIRNGVSKIPINESTEYIRQWGLSDRGYVLAVGRLVREKGFDKLIEAFKRLPPSSLKLVIAGAANHNDHYVEQLQAACHNYDNILMTGFIKGESLAQLYEHASLFVLPSSHEGLPIVLLEAMSHGCPIVASNIPANREIGLPENCYFRSGDVEALQNALTEKLTNTQQKKIVYDLSDYDWKNIANQTKNLYNSMCQSNIG